MSSRSNKPRPLPVSLAIEALTWARGAVTRPVRTRLSTLRRDVESLAARFVGAPPQPVIHRRPPDDELAPVVAAHDDDAPPVAAAAPAAASALHPRHVRIAAIERETVDAVTLHLEDPAGAPFHYLPGQFFTVCLTIGGESLRRAYSASSSPLAPGRLSLTCKRIPGGLVSTWLNEVPRAGERLELLGPSGSFTVDPQPDTRRDVVLIAGGSGITPMMSIARTVLAVEPASRVFLLYGNRSPADIIFARALETLAAAHPERLSVRHVLADAPDTFDCGRGLLTRDVVAAELARWTDLAADAEYFLCGPEAMMAEAKAALLGAGVDERRVREERFTQPHRRPHKATDGAGAQLVTVRRGGVETPFTVAAGQTVLEAGLAAGLPMPFSCAMGGCGACQVKLVDGEMELEEPNCLLPEERAEGWVLTCVGRPRTAVTVEVVG